MAQPVGVKASVAIHLPRIQTLPTALRQYLFEFVELIDLNNLSSVCRLWRADINARSNVQLLKVLFRKYIKEAALKQVIGLDHLRYHHLHALQAPRLIRQKGNIESIPGSSIDAAERQLRVKYGALGDENNEAFLFLLALRFFNGNHSAIGYEEVAKKTGAFEWRHLKPIQYMNILKKALRDRIFLLTWKHLGSPKNIHPHFGREAFLGRVFKKDGKIFAITDKDRYRIIMRFFELKVREMPREQRIALLAAK